MTSMANSGGVMLQYWTCLFGQHCNTSFEHLLHCFYVVRGPVGGSRYVGDPECFVAVRRKKKGERGSRVSLFKNSVGSVMQTSREQILSI